MIQLTLSKDFAPDHKHYTCAHAWVYMPLLKIIIIIMMMIMIMIMIIISTRKSLLPDFENTVKENPCTFMPIIR